MVKFLKSFTKDSTFFRGIRGPVGSGKSVACSIEVFRRSLMQNKISMVKENKVGSYKKY